MKLRTVLIMGFVLISFFVVITGVLIHNELNTVATLSENNVLQTKEELQRITTANRLSNLAQIITYYDEVLTQSARNYAFTADKKWKERYQEIEPQLDSRLKDAIANGDEIDARYFESTDEANRALVDIEVRAFALVDEGNTASAQSLLESEEYWTQKRVYAKGLEDYAHRRNSLHKDTLATSLELINERNKVFDAILATTQKFSIFIILIFSLLSLCIGFIFSTYVMGKITTTLELLRAPSSKELINMKKISYFEEISEMISVFVARKRK